MIRPFFVSLTLFGLLLSVRVWGYEFTHLTKDNNGLSYDGISAIMQDSRGFIWIGTYKGLNRYDGNTFKVYGMLEMGLDSDFVYSIVEDSEGNLWIGTDKGVCMYSYRQDRFVPLRTVSSEGSVITNKVTFITVEPDGRVWMLVNDQGCFAYDIHRGELHEWPYRKIGFSGFRKMLRCVDGDVWISRYHSNLYHADSSFREVHPVVLGDQSDFFEDDEIEGLFYAPDGSLLVASMKRGLSEVDLVAKRVEVLLALPENSLLQHAFLENDRNVWLSTSKGVWRYDLLTGESLCLRNDEMDMFSLSNDYTTCTFVDKDGGLWVGTKDAGVNYSGPSQNNFEKQYLADGESLENVMVSGFAEDEAGRIWVATEEKGLLVYDPQAHRTSKYRLEGIPSRICSICYDDGYLWFGTRVGLFRLDIAANRLKVYGVLKRVQGVNDPNVYMIYKTSDGEIFVGTTLGLFRYERSSDSFLEIPAFDGIFTTSAVEDPLHPGVVWFSSYANGVYCWDSISDKLVNYDASSGCGLTNDKICSIFIDHKARIWAVGFSIGVAMFDRESGRFTVYDRRNVQALTSDVFFKALEDKAGNLWLASDEGLVEFNPEIGGGYVYTRIDGLLDSKFTNSAFRSASGDMYFGSDNGFIRFNPEALPRTSNIPSVVLSSMQIGDHEARFAENLDLMSKISLDRENNSFGFNFSLLGLSAPFSNKVQCLLEGYESSWRDIAATKSVFYYNVPPGQYRLRVRAQSDEKWMEVRPPLVIAVHPGFWASVPGAMLVVLIVLVVFLLCVLVIQHRLRLRKEREQEAYQKAKDEEMFHEKMNFFSHVIHEIKTPLTLIKTPLSNVMSRCADEENQHDLNVMYRSAEYLSKLVNELLDYVRIERMGYALKCEPVDFLERLHSLLFSFADVARDRNLTIEVQADLEQAVVYADSAALDKILNNLLLNAIKYAETSLTICVRTDEGRVVADFINDGPGIPKEYRDEIFKPFVQYQNDSTPVSGGVGIGLPLAKNLARMHSGDLILSGRTDVTDFVLTLPMVDSEEKTPEMGGEELFEEEKKTGPELPCILIVDDNREFREYLASKLAENYAILMAPTGVEALKILKESDVDMLLTDISMPGMSGLELCAKVREDIEISHIPVLIISARGSVQSKIQAMQAGADLYIEKPFDLQYLVSSIENILDRRVLLRNALEQGVSGMAVDMFGLPRKDEEFLEKFSSIIRENLGNAELSNEFLAEQMNMSQSTLVRKIRKLLNTSPNNYVRSMRIAAAAEMLKNSHGNNISEICYSVGFSNLSYFTKCFKEKYGKTPTEIVRDQASEQ